MSDFSIASAAVSALLSVSAALFAARIASQLVALLDRITRCEAQLLKLSAGSTGSATLASRLDELEETIAVLANRVKMQRVRNSATHAEKPSSDLPDPHRDPDGWRNAMNQRLARARLGK